MRRVCELCLPIEAVERYLRQRPADVAKVIPIAPRKTFDSAGCFVWVLF